MNEKTKPESTEDGNGHDADAGAVAAAAAASLADGPTPLDPNRPMFHLVPPIIMQDVIAILKRLPYEDVARVMPALMQSEIHQAPRE